MFGKCVYALSDSSNSQCKCLPYTCAACKQSEEEPLKISQSGGTVHKNMLKEGLIKEVVFTGTPLEIIDVKIESEFEVL
ncbi:3300_t:CDS:2, partial [Diversispora eburnea]